MRKLTIGLVALFALLVTTLSATAAPATHKVVGGGWWLNFENEKVTVGFTAQSDENGIVNGHIQVNERASPNDITFFGSYDIDVNNLDVVDNKAKIGGIVTKAIDRPDLVGKYLEMVVVDNGQGEGTMDQMSWTNENVPFSANLEDFNGNIQIS